MREGRFWFSLVCVGFFRYMRNKYFVFFFYLESKVLVNSVWGWLLVKKAKVELVIIVVGGFERKFFFFVDTFFFFEFSFFR